MLLLAGAASATAGVHGELAGDGVMVLGDQLTAIGGEKELLHIRFLERENHVGERERGAGDRERWLRLRPRKMGWPSQVKPRAQL